MCHNRGMKKILLSLILIFGLELSAQDGERVSTRPEVSEEELRNEVLLPRIDLKYRSGGYLIYDCEDQHFVCVDARGFGQCDVDRQESRERGRLILSCSPLKRFQSFELCLEELYRLMHQSTHKSICLNPKAI